MIPEDTVLDFAGTLFRSVWALELLLALKGRAERAWHASDIVRELRGSRVVVDEALNNLVAAGLVVQEDTGGYLYVPDLRPPLNWSMNWKSCARRSRRQ